MNDLRSMQELRAALEYALATGEVAPTLVDVVDELRHVRRLSYEETYEIAREVSRVSPARWDEILYEVDALSWVEPAHSRRWAHEIQDAKWRRKQPGPWLTR